MHEWLEWVLTFLAVGTPECCSLYRKINWILINYREISHSLHCAECEVVGPCYQWPVRSLDPGALETGKGAWSHSTAAGMGRWPEQDLPEKGTLHQCEKSKITIIIMAGRYLSGGQDMTHLGLRIQLMDCWIWEIWPHPLQESQFHRRWSVFKDK